MPAVVLFSDKSISNLFDAGVESFVRLSTFTYRHAFRLTTEGRRDLSDKILLEASQPLLAVTGLTSDVQKADLNRMLDVIEQLQSDLRSSHFSKSEKKSKAKQLVQEAKEYKRMAITTSTSIANSVATNGVDSPAFKLYEACCERNFDSVDLVRYVRSVVNKEEGEAPVPRRRPQAIQNDAHITEGAERAQLRMADCLQALPPAADSLDGIEEDFVQD